VNSLLQPNTLMHLFFQSYRWQLLLLLFVGLCTGYGRMVGDTIGDVVSDVVLVGDTVGRSVRFLVGPTLGEATCGPATRPRLQQSSPLLR